MGIDNPNLWFALAAGSGLLLGFAGSGLLLGFLVYLLGYFDGRDAGDVDPEWVSMVEGARCDCRRCGGTGWVPSYEDRAITHCRCTRGRVA